MFAPLKGWIPPPAFTGLEFAELLHAQCFYVCELLHVPYLHQGRKDFEVYRDMKVLNNTYG
jgi:hypothetical protein